MLVLWQVVRWMKIPHLASLQHISFSYRIDTRNSV